MQKPPKVLNAVAEEDVFTPAYKAPVSFTFLNQSQSFATPETVDWNYSGFGKLWTYNLNYFDFIVAPSYPTELAEALIKSWIDKGSAKKDGWEPYPTSLRIMNWLVFYHERKTTSIPQLVQQSLKRQYNDLWRKVEYHLMGNHLLENTIALVAGAFYFQDQQRWRKATSLLQAQLKEQYRPEGIHFELSNMYHCLLLNRLLQLYQLISAQQTMPSSLLRSHEHATKSTDIATLKSEKIRLALKKNLVEKVSWLTYFIDESGHYPHFNDSTAGIAPKPKDLLAEAQQLGIQPQSLAPEISPALRHISVGSFDLWLDLGALGPDYIPGHGHADNLHCCLSYKGKRILVDQGVSTYEKNERRHAERSTASHNTVVVAGENSSETWGGFRVGRRAKTIVLAETATSILAEHDGYHHLGSFHRRRFKWTEQRIDIMDEIGSGGGQAFWHFSPDTTISQQENCCTINDDLQFVFEGANSIEILDYEYAASFNQLLQAKKIRVSFTEQLNTTIRATFAEHETTVSN